MKDIMREKFEKWALKTGNFYGTRKKPTFDRLHDDWALWREAWQAGYNRAPSELSGTTEFMGMKFIENPEVPKCAFGIASKCIEKDKP